MVQVAAAGVNRPDLLQRQGLYPPPPGASDIPGLEVAGTIVSGDLDNPENQYGFKIGSQVCALLSGGGYAQYAAVPIVQCLPVPAGMDLSLAAALPETFFTVWTNVFDRAGLGRGPAGKDETLLIQGGASGIGVAAIQMAKARGHRVFVTAGTDEKCAACKEIGADVAINYKTQKFEDEVKAATGGRGVDVILDMVAGDYIPREINALADDGRIAIIALLGGAEATVDLRQVLMRRLTIAGSTLRARPVEFKGAIAANLYKHVWPLIESGKIRPIIHKTFRAEEAAAAHQELEKGEHVGKIVLIW